MEDRYGRKIKYLRLSVTDKCNLRCRYCMPEEGVCRRRHEDMLTEDEMIMAVECAAALGISKLRITGGEPLVKKNILSICRRAAAVEGIEELCLTTNGTLLPEMAATLREAGVRRVNISLDSLDENTYEYITRRPQLGKALEGIKCALEAGFERVKINAVLLGGVNEGEIEALAQLTREHDVDLRFIELMPMGADSGFGAEAMLGSNAVLERLPQLRAEETVDGVAKLYRLPGARGSIGLISPVSEGFCHRCDRLRLTADGRLKPCLHSGEEFSVKGLSRAEMEEQFKRAIMEKPAHRCSFGKSGRAMNAIGG